MNPLCYVPALFPSVLVGETEVDAFIDSRYYNFVGGVMERISVTGWKSLPSFHRTS
jgi:hypothetical protein